MCVSCYWHTNVSVALFAFLVTLLHFNSDCLITLLSRFTKHPQNAELYSTEPRCDSFGSCVERTCQTLLQSFALLMNCVSSVMSVVQCSCARGVAGAMSTCMLRFCCTPLLLLISPSSPHFTNLNLLCRMLRLDGLGLWWLL